MKKQDQVPQGHGKAASRAPLIEAARLALAIPAETQFWDEVEQHLEAEDAARRPKVESRVTGNAK